MKIKFTLIDDNGKEFSGETVLTPEEHPTKKSKKITQTYSGLKGGIEFLMDNKYLDILKSSKDVHLELKKENYFHSKESVDKRLRFLVSKKTLARIKDEDIWKYALRK